MVKALTTARDKFDATVCGKKTVLPVKIGGEFVNLQILRCFGSAVGYF